VLLSIWTKVVPEQGNEISERVPKAAVTKLGNLEEEGRGRTRMRRRKSKKKKASPPIESPIRFQRPTED
jgi:hypothetical protein